MFLGRGVVGAHLSEANRGRHLVPERAGQARRPNRLFEPDDNRVAECLTMTVRDFTLINNRKGASTNA